MQNYNFSMIQTRGNNTFSTLHYVKTYTFSRIRPFRLIAECHQTSVPITSFEKNASTAYNGMFSIHCWSA